MEIKVNDDLVHLKKGKFGYRVIHPTKDSNGKIIWINALIGGWENFFKLLFIMLVILLFLYGVRGMNQSCRDFAEDPCKYTNLNCEKEFNYDPTQPYNQGMRRQLDLDLEVKDGEKKGS